MAKTNLATLPTTIRKVSKFYQAFPKIKDKKQKNTPYHSANGMTGNSHLIAGDTLSDWRRKSATTTPPNYPSEHRRDRRRASRLNVHVYRHGKTLGTTRTCDINARGLGVECAKLNLHEGEVVEIDLPEYAVPDGIASHACCLVVHTGEQCGLMFLDLKDR